MTLQALHGNTLNPWTKQEGLTCVLKPAELLHGIALLDEIIKLNHLTC